MTDDDRPAFAAQMTLLGEAYSETLTPARLGIYFDALRDFELAYVRAAVRQAIKSTKFFPKPAELLEWASDARGAVRVAERKSAQKALGDGGGMTKRPPSDFAQRISEGQRAMEEEWRTTPSVLERMGHHELRPAVQIRLVREGKIPPWQWRL